MPDGDVKICEPGGKGLFLPSSDGEQNWPNGVRGFLYGFAMAYCFLGVSIVADTFMGSIEVVTSRKRQLRLKGGRLLTYRVWNDTVANLTLMALGSSAPEILLSVIELVKNGMYSGDLGPSTIVGSAAFNLLVIISLCISVIPTTEHRKVKELPVLYITVVFSIFAYLWLVVILSVTSPDIVDVWEAIVTFLCFPALVWIAWMADTGMFAALTRKRSTKIRFSNTGEVPEHIVEQICDTLGARDGETITMIKKNISASNIGSNPSSSELEALILTLSRQQAALAGPKDSNGSGRKSRATHRQEATRAFTGGKRVVSQTGRASSTGREGDEEPTNGKKSPGVMAGSTTNGSMTPQNLQYGASMQVNCGESEMTENIIQFAHEQQCLSKGLSSKTVMVVRSGDNTFDLSVTYSVHLPQAQSLAQSQEISDQAVYSNGEDRIVLGEEVACGTMLFQAGERSMEILVQKPSVMPGTGEVFLVHLKKVEVADPAVWQEIAIGPMRTTQVTPGLAGVAGRFSFMSERLLVQGTSESQVVEVTVLRNGGCCGAVSCNYVTEKMSAIPGRDYEEAEGKLKFAEGVTEQIIQLEILPKSVHQWSDELLLVLKDAEGGAEFDPNDDGGPDSAIITVIINALDVVSSAPSLRVLRWLDRKFNLDELRVGSADWCDQFTSAAWVNGSREEQAEASCADWFFHIVSLPWKMLFTLVPPTSFCNGWVCFYTSLCFIGLVTAVIGDLAELFGCVLDVPDAVTAITFVALGTSMPDLFASHSAAIQASTSAAFVTLWFGYITLASWQVLRSDKADKMEYVTVFIVTLTITGSVAVCPVVLLLRYARNPQELGGSPFSGNEDTDGDIHSLDGTGEDSEGKHERFRGNEIAGTSVEALVKNHQNGNGHTHEDEIPAKSVDPPDVAAGPPVLPEGAPPFAQTALAVANTELTQSPRSSPPANQADAGNSDWQFRDRQVVQPPATPYVELDLMSPSSPAIQGNRRADSPTSHQHWAQLLPAHEQAASVIGAAQLRGRGESPVQNYSLTPASSALGAAHMSLSAPSSPMSKAKFSL